MPICSRHFVFFQCRKSVLNFKKQAGIFLFLTDFSVSLDIGATKGSSTHFRQWFINCWAGLCFYFSELEEFGTALADKPENILLHTLLRPLSFLCCRHSRTIPPVNSVQSAPAALIFAFLAQEHIQLFSNTKLTLNSSCKLRQISQWFHFKAAEVKGLTLKQMWDVLSSVTS